MNPLNKITRYFFQKTSGAFSTAQTEVRNRMRYNALFMLDPDVLVRHLAAFAAGDIAGLEHVIDEFENRDDKMKIGSFKMSAAVASKPWEVRINKGEEDNERARLHKEVLTRFWNRIRVTDAFCRNRRGGVRMLVKQMMSAQSRVYAVHDVTWKTRGDGELEATFTHIPAWCFENRTGELRYIQDPGGYTGVPMKEGEWLVTVGEGVGVTATVLAMAKRLSWNDWLLFSEKCGMPVILANTGAKQDTPAWKALEAAVASIAPKTGLLADMDSKIQAVSIGGSSGQTTYRELVETVDRSISALYRGGDLATMSHGGDGVGSNAQDGESELMDADGCAMVGETLQEQIERHVIRFTCGDFEPLAGIVINPPAETEDIDREIKIDQHLGEFGVKISKKDMLERYGRTEAASEDDAATRKVGGDVPGAPFGGFANEAAVSSRPPYHRFSGRAGSMNPPQDDILAAFAADNGPLATAIQDLLKDLEKDGAPGTSRPTRERIDAFIADLPSLLPDDPALAAVIAEEMAKQFNTPAGKTQEAGQHTDSQDSQALTNAARDTGYLASANNEDLVAFANENGECESEDHPHCRVHGTPETRPISEQLAELGYKDKNDVYSKADGVSKDRVSQIVSGKLKEHCSVHEAVAALRTNHTVMNAFGNKVTFGDDMIIHYLGGYGRSNNQPDAKRLKELPMAIHAVINCSNPRLQYPKGVTHDPLNPPRGTQYVYHEKVGNGDMQCRAWVDSGKVKGWFVK